MLSDESDSANGRSEDSGSSISSSEEEMNSCRSQRDRSLPKGWITFSRKKTDYLKCVESKEFPNHQILCCLASLLRKEDSHIYIQCPHLTSLRHEEEEEESLPDYAECVAVVFVPERPVMVLAFVTEETDAAQIYISNLASTLITTVRESSRTSRSHLNTFTPIHGVINRDTWGNLKCFNEKLVDIETEHTLNSNLSALKMTAEDQIFCSNLLLNIPDVPSEPYCEIRVLGKFDLLQFWIEEMEKMAEKSNMVEIIYLLCGESLFFPDRLEEDMTCYQNLQCFKDIYLHPESQMDRLHVSYPELYDACLLVVDKKYPGLLWKECSVTFADDEHGLPKRRVFISRQVADKFLTQIVKTLKQGNVSHRFTALSHGVLRAKENIDKLFKLIDLKFIINAYSEEFLFWVVHSKNDDLLKTVLEKPEITQRDVDTLLAECIKLAYGEDFLSLRHHLQNLQRQDIRYNADYRDSKGNTYLMIAMESGSELLINELKEDCQDLRLQRNTDKRADEVNTSLDMFDINSINLTRDSREVHGSTKADNENTNLDSAHMDVQEQASVQDLNCYGSASKGGTSYFETEKPSMKYREDEEGMDTSINTMFQRGMIPRNDVNNTL